MVLTMIQDASYYVFFDILMFSPLLASFVAWAAVDSVLVSNPLSVSVACSSSFARVFCLGSTCQLGLC